MSSSSEREGGRWDDRPRRAIGAAESGRLPGVADGAVVDAATTGSGADPGVTTDFAVETGVAGSGVVLGVPTRSLDTADGTVIETAATDSGAVPDVASDAAAAGTATTGSSAVTVVSAGPRKSTQPNTCAGVNTRAMTAEASETKRTPSASVLRDSLSALAPHHPRRPDWRPDRRPRWPLTWRPACRLGTLPPTIRATRPEPTLGSPSPSRLPRHVPFPGAALAAAHPGLPPRLPVHGTLPLERLPLYLPLRTTRDMSIRTGDAETGQHIRAPIVASLAAMFAASGEARHVLKYR